MSRLYGMIGACFLAWAAMAAEGDTGNPTIKDAITGGVKKVKDKIQTHKAWQAFQKEYWDMPHNLTLWPPSKICEKESFKSYGDNCIPWAAKRWAVERYNQRRYKHLELGDKNWSDEDLKLVVQALADLGKSNLQWIKHVSLSKLTLGMVASLRKFSSGYHLSLPAKGQDPEPLKKLLAFGTPVERLRLTGLFSVETQKVIDSKTLKAPEPTPEEKTAEKKRLEANLKLLEGLRVNTLDLKRYIVQKEYVEDFLKALKTVGYINVLDLTGTAYFGKERGFPPVFDKSQIQELKQTGKIGRIEGVDKSLKQRVGEAWKDAKQRVKDKFKRQEPPAVPQLPIAEQLAQEGAEKAYEDMPELNRD